MKKYEYVCLTVAYFNLRNYSFKCYNILNFNYVLTLSVNGGQKLILGLHGFINARYFQQNGP